MCSEGSGNDNSLFGVAFMAVFIIFVSFEAGLFRDLLFSTAQLLEHIVYFFSYLIFKNVLKKQKMLNNGSKSILIANITKKLFQFIKL